MLVCKRLQDVVVSSETFFHSINFNSTDWLSTTYRADAPYHAVSYPRYNVAGKLPSLSLYIPTREGQIFRVQNQQQRYMQIY